MRNSLRSCTDSYIYIYIYIYRNRCGNNYGWSRFEGSRCQEAMEARDGPCLDADRSGFTFPMYEYCHPDFNSDDADEADFVAGVDICGDRLLTGTAVMGKLTCTVPYRTVVDVSHVACFFMFEHTCGSSDLLN